MLLTITPNSKTKIKHINFNKHVNRYIRWSEEPSKYTHSVTLVKMKSEYSIFCNSEKSRSTDWDSFCIFFPEIIETANSLDIELSYSGFTDVSGSSWTLIKADGPDTKLTELIDIHGNHLSKYGILLNNVSGKYIFNEQNYFGEHLYREDAEKHNSLVIEFCPHKITYATRFSHRYMIQDKMMGPWSSWENGFCFHNEDDMVMAAMLLL